MSEETVYKAEEAAKLRTQTSLPALALIGTGVFLLLAYVFDLHLIELLWPGFIIVPGLLLVYPAYKSTPDNQSRSAFLAIPGAMIAAFGGLMFAMNLADHFEAAAYTWPLVIAAAAAGVMYVSRYDDNAALQERGLKFIRAMVLVFISLAFLFEIIFFENFNPLMSLGLIGLGVYLLLRSRRTTKSA